MTTYYQSTPWMETYTDRESLATDIQDTILNSGEATTEFRRIHGDGEMTEWAWCAAYDLIDDAVRDGKVERYGITLYADDKTHRLTEELVGEVDPYCGDEERVSVFISLYERTVQDFR